MDHLLRKVDSLSQKEGRKGRRQEERWEEESSIDVQIQFTGEEFPQVLGLFPTLKYKMVCTTFLFSKGSLT